MQDWITNLLYNIGAKRAPEVNPQASDETLLNIYQGRYNPDYVSPDFLRQVEANVKAYMDSTGVPQWHTNTIRNRALRNAGGFRDQYYSDVPQKILGKVFVDMPVYGNNSGE